MLILGALLPGYKSVALPANLATNGTATGSSEGYGSVFADANDGNRAGHFYNNGSVWHTVIPDANAYYEVDLGGTFFLDRVMIWPRTDAIQGTVRNFRLSVFDAAGQLVWQHDYLPTNDAANVWATTQVRSVQGRRVRFARLDQVGNNWLTFAEFRTFFGDRVQQHLFNHGALSLSNNLDAPTQFNGAPMPRPASGSPWKTSPPRCSTERRRSATLSPRSNPVSTAW